MKAVGVAFVVLALGAIIVLARWPYEPAPTKRRGNENPTDADTNGIMPGSGGEKPDYGHHGGDDGGHGGGDGGH